MATLNIRAAPKWPSGAFDFIHQFDRRTRWSLLTQKRKKVHASENRTYIDMWLLASLYQVSSPNQHQKLKCCSAKHSEKSVILSFEAVSPKLHSFLLTQSHKHGTRTISEWAQPYKPTTITDLEQICYPHTTLVATLQSTKIDGMLKRTTCDKLC